MKDQVFWKSAKLISIIGFCTFPLDGTLGGEVTKMVGFDSKYSAHWIYKPPSVIRVAAAIGSAAALSRGWI